MKTETLCVDCKERLASLEEKKLIGHEDRQLLENPERVIQAELPLRRDDGTLEILTAFRIQHSTKRGPAKGGIRFHQEVDPAEVAALAFVMSLKTALLDLPYGGGKGGVQFNPKEYSTAEIEQVSRLYMRAFADVLGPHKDVPAPDVNTTPEIIGWMRDEYAHITGKDEPAIITGKPVEKGGSEGRGTATAMGAYFILKERFAAQAPQEVSVAIQGFGNAGSILAELLYNDGFKVVAVSDSRGAIYNEEGLDIHAVAKHKPERNPISKFDGGSPISNAALLALEVDLLVPAALGDAITTENVTDVKASVIIEVANGPITTGAEHILDDRGVEIIPDLLANAGGVTVSYFEWFQNIHNERWTEEEVNQKLQGMIADSYHRTKQISQEHEVSLRDAAYKIAIDRIGMPKHS